MNNENDWLEECWNYPSGYYAGTQPYCCLLKISDTHMKAEGTMNPN